MLKWFYSLHRNFPGVWIIWARSVLVRSASDGVPQGSAVGPLYFADLRNTVLVCRLRSRSVPRTPEAKGFSSSRSPPNYNPRLRTPHPPPQHNTHTYTQLSEDEAGGGIRSSLVVPDRKSPQSACVTVCYRASGNISEGKRHVRKMKDGEQKRVGKIKIQRARK